MSDEPSQASESATDVTITYQSSINDESVSIDSSSASHSDGVASVEREQVRLVDLPKKIIEVGEVIGKGGMGIVRIARQHLPDREVAVKRLHFAKARLAKALLDEAMIMGGLEHPNIVPVHLVRLTEDNSPEVVMKYIQGKAWNDVLSKQAQRGEYLLDAIDVLRSVCRAVEFAHSRGVIHRDIKPHNVMLGRFGEVYLMDWGIAIRTMNIDRVPAGLVGTPGYLAPEMLSGNPPDVTFQTDVFLLGATLHAVLTGQRRHRANNVVAALDAAGKSEPYSYPPDVPSELADIANRACCKNPADRFQSAADFRNALEKYLSLREAFMVRDRAIEKMHDFERLISTRDRRATDGTQVRQRFAEARFGLEQALQMSPECDGAEKALQRLLSLMTRWLLKGNNIDEAAHILSALPRPVSELEEEVLDRRNVAIREAKEIEYLKQIAPDYDPEKNKRGRAIFGIAIIAVVTLTVVSVLIYDTLNPQKLSPRRLVLSTGAVALIVCIAVGLNRRWIFGTNMGKRLLHTIVLGFCAAPLLAAASINAGYDANAIMLADTLFVALAMAASYPIIRSGRIAGGFAASNVCLAGFLPEWAHTGFMLSTAFGAVCIVYDWILRDDREGSQSSP